MSNPKAKTLPDIMSMFFSIFITLCIDLFLIRSDLTVLGDTVFMSVCGLVILFLYMKASKDSLRIFGISKRGSKITSGILYGFVFALLPLAFVNVAEGVFIAATDTNLLDISFKTPNMINTDAEGITPGLACMIYILTCFIGVFFKEIFFRGFLLKKINKVAGFAKANIIQSVLYVTFVLMYLLRSVPEWLRSGKTDFKTATLIVLFCVAHELFTGIKWGLMTRVSGSTYMAIVDHYLYSFLSVGIFLTPEYTIATYLLRLAIIQLLSYILVLIYYSIGMRRINKKKEKERKRAEAELKKRRTEVSDKNINFEDIEEISPDSFKNIVHESVKQRKKSAMDESALENKIELENVLKEEVVHKNDETVDAILKDVSREMRRREKPSESKEITDDFDSDDFLKAYQRQDGSHHHSHKNKHHHNSLKAERKESEKPVIDSEPKKAMAKKPKRTFSQRLQSLGGIDDSSSNGFI